jgi:hypothetical protein
MLALRPYFSLLTFTLSALLGGGKALADATVRIDNQSTASWLLRVVADGSATGGKLNYNHLDLAPGDEVELRPGKVTEVSFIYNVSYQVRFQLVDSKKNWAEFQSAKSAMELFSGAKRYTHLFNNLQDPAGATVGMVIHTDSPSNGGILISAAGLSETSALNCPDGSRAPTLKAPFASTYWINPTGQEFKVGVAGVLFDQDGTSMEAVVKGEVILTDLKGREIGRISKQSSSKLTLPAHSILRAVFNPDSSGAHQLDLILSDPAGTTLRIIANNTRTWPNVKQLWLAAGQDAVLMNLPNKWVNFNQYPGSGDMTLVAGAFPDWAHDNRNPHP